MRHAATKKARKYSFLKRRNKKLLLASRNGSDGTKVFWFFFSKKNCLLPWARRPSPACCA
jgi:hypothetical protein